MLNLLSALLIIFFVTHASAAVSADCQSFQKAVATGKEGEKLKRFFDTQWKYTMKDDPEYATYAGVDQYGDQWKDLSPQARQKRKSEVQCQKQALQKVRRENLNDFDKISYDLNLKKLNEALELQQYDGEYLVLDQMGGVHMNISDLLWSMPKATVVDFEKMLSRLKKVPVLIDQNIALLREGIERKVTPPQLLLKRIPSQFDEILTPKVEDSPIYKALTDFKPTIPEAAQEHIKREGKKVLQEQVEPALKKFKEFIIKEYIPNSRTSTSWADLPHGKAWYGSLVRSHTTTNRSPEDLHSLGLKEVARIQAEMEKIKNQVKFSGDLQAFNKFLLTDKQFYFDNPKDLIVAYRDIGKRIDPELPKLFKTLPRLPYGIREMALYKAPSAPTAYYQPGSPQSGRAGYFEANTYDLKARPKWGMEVLTIHEAVPGHHLQISLAQEMEGLPEFRKNEGPTSFVEGWALYAESLGEEIGFYKDPYSKYGELSYEMWRAVRLVVDTGMHEFGWSRERALQYYMDHLPKSQSESENEIDRYIVMPGQALAYKVGQLKFQELRARARAVLGDQFDVREFHDEMLRHGAIPLDVLESAFQRWLEGKKKKAVRG